MSRCHNGTLNMSHGTRVRSHVAIHMSHGMLSNMMQEADVDSDGQVCVHSSHIVLHMSPGTLYMSHVALHMSHDTIYMSYGTCNTSRVTFYMSHGTLIMSHGTLSIMMQEAGRDLDGPGVCTIESRHTTIESRHATIESRHTPYDQL